MAKYYGCKTKNPRYFYVFEVTNGGATVKHLGATDDLAGDDLDPDDHLKIEDDNGNDVTLFAVVKDVEIKSVHKD